MVFYFHLLFKRNVIIILLVFVNAADVEFDHLSQASISYVSGWIFSSFVVPMAKRFRAHGRGRDRCVPMLRL